MMQQKSMEAWELVVAGNIELGGRAGSLGWGIDRRNIAAHGPIAFATRAWRPWWVGGAS